MAQPDGAGKGASAESYLPARRLRSKRLTGGAGGGAAGPNGGGPAGSGSLGINGLGEGSALGEVRSVLVGAASGKRRNQQGGILGMGINTLLGENDIQDDLAIMLPPLSSRSAALAAAASGASTLQGNGTKAAPPPSAGLVTGSGSGGRRSISSSAPPPPPAVGGSALAPARQKTGRGRGQVHKAKKGKVALPASSALAAGTLRRTPLIPPSSPRSSSVASQDDDDDDEEGDEVAEEREQHGNDDGEAEEEEEEEEDTFDKKASAAALPSSTGKEAHSKDGKFYFYDETYCKGDGVIVDTPDSSELIGVITAIGSGDLWIQIDDDAKLKVTFHQLQVGRYILRRQS